MIKKLVLLAIMSLIVQLAQADENLFAENYKSQNKGNLQSMQADPQTKMYASSHKDEDNISMLEDGYDLIGSSAFVAPSGVSADLALQHAKSIKADVVLVYSKYGSKASPLSKIEVIKEAAKNSGEVDASVLNDDNEKFKYYASYWAKLPMPILGLHVIKLRQKDSESETFEDANGLKVLAVIKDSPAAKANLLRGDVLLKLGNISLQKPEQLFAAVKKYQGKTVDIAYERDGAAATTKATLNNK